MLWKEVYFSKVGFGFVLNMKVVVEDEFDLK